MTAAQTPPVAESVELLPCPFCGGEPRRYTANPYPGFEDRQVQCDRCGASAFDSKWNTRADPAIAASYEAGRAEGVRAAEQLRTALIQARSDFHLISLHGEMRPMWEDAKAGRDRVHDALVSIDASCALSKEPTK